MVHGRAEFHQAIYSGSWVIVFTKLSGRWTQYCSAGSNRRHNVLYKTGSSRRAWKYCTARDFIGVQ